MTIWCIMRSEHAVIDRITEGKVFLKNRKKSCVDSFLGVDIEVDSERGGLNPIIRTRR